MYHVYAHANACICKQIKTNASKCKQTQGMQANASTCKCNQMECIISITVVCDVCSKPRKHKSCLKSSAQRGGQNVATHAVPKLKYMLREWNVIK